jgi:hypothetical protein
MYFKDYKSLFYLFIDFLMKIQGAEQSEKRTFTKGRVAEMNGLEGNGRRREGKDLRRVV